MTDSGKLIALECALEVVHREALASRSRLEELQNWVDKSEEEGVALRGEVETWQSRAQLAENDVQHLRGALVALESKAPERQTDDTVVLLSAELSEKEEALEGAAQRIAALEAHSAAMDERLVAMQKQNELLNEARAEQRQKALDLQSRLDEAQRMIAEAGAAREAMAIGLEQRTPPPPPPEDAPELLADEDVIDAPMEAVEAMVTEQTNRLMAATEAIVTEQAAVAQNVDDLSWLKAELEKLTHVRDELRLRIQAMLDRELSRRSVLAKLLETLRTNEVTHAARVGSLRRLQAAIELAQRTAADAQTVYFQKQIGSLHRQLQAAQKVARRG